MKKKSWLRSVVQGALIVGAGTCLTAHADEQKQPMAKPLIDTSKNPGCGVKGLNREQKIERNLNLLKMYFQTYNENVHTGKMLGWSHYGCLADPWTLVPGTFRPYAQEIKVPANTGDGGLGEMQAYWEAIPDLATVPGTFVGHAWEGGAWSRQNWIGHAKKDGRKIELWETELILVNDEGKITRWEFWGDTIGAQDSIMETHGIDIKNLPLKDYEAAIQKKLAERNQRLEKK